MSYKTEAHKHGAKTELRNLGCLSDGPPKMAQTERRESELVVLHTMA